MKKSLVMEFIDAAVGDHKKAQRMLVQNPELINARYTLGETVLHFMCVENFIRGVRFLLENGAEVDARNEFGETALVAAVTLSLFTTVEALLEYGADPNVVSNSLGHVLHVAVAVGNDKIVAALLAHGAHTDYVDDVGHTLADRITKDPVKRARIMAVLIRYAVSTTKP